MADTFVDDNDRLKVSKFLYRFAWAIEIIAASIALTIAWFQIYDARGDQSVAEKYMAALPFIAVMLVELTKIPFSRVFFSVQSMKWKLVFATGLSLAMIITFETFALGFERFQSITTREIVELQFKITEQQNIIKEHENQQAYFEEAQKTKEFDSKDHQAQVDRINLQYDKSRESLDSRKKTIYEKYDVLKSSDIELKSIQDQINSLTNERNNQIKRLEESQENQIKQLSKNDETRINSNNDQIKSLIDQQNQERERAANQRKELTDKIKNSGFFERTEPYQNELERVNESETKRIQEIQAQINRLQTSSNTTDQINNITKETQVAINQINQNFNPRIADLQKQKIIKEKKLVKKSDIQNESDNKELKEIDRQIAANEQQRQESLNKLNTEYQKTQQKYTSAQEREQVSSEQRDDAAKKLLPLCVDLNTMVNKNQIYRIAMQVHGVRDACELDEDQISTVKKVWFGSIALVVSGLGTLTAFGSFILGSPPSSSKTIRPVSYHIRRVFYALRKKLKEPRIVKKEVIKEVPVDRIQIKVVEKEVPVEKVKIQEVPVPEVRYVREEVKVPVVEKEYIHVPVYTDDPTKVEWAKKSQKK